MVNDLRDSESFKYTFTTPSSLTKVLDPVHIPSHLPYLTVNLKPRGAPSNGWYELFPLLLTVDYTLCQTM